MGFCKELREPVASMAREKSKWQNHKDESTDARHWDGPTCMSVEDRVMRSEQRGWIRWLSSWFNCDVQEETLNETRRAN